jgi:hypothetical protein
MTTRYLIAVLSLAGMLACGGSGNNGSGGGSGGGTAGGSGGGTAGGSGGGTAGGAGGGTAGGAGGGTAGGSGGGTAGGSGGGTAGGSGGGTAGGSGGGTAGGSGGGTAGGAGGGSGGGSGTPHTATINGRVGAYAGLPDAGTTPGTVTVYAISSSGTLSAISSPATVAANNSYSATANYTGNAPADVLVGFHAADAGPVDAGPGDAGVLPNTITALALVAAPLTASGTVTAPPINAQAGAQADVELWALQQNAWTANTTTAEVELLLTTYSTDWLSNSTNYYPDINAAGAATISAINTRAAVITNESGGVAAQLTSFLAAETTAQLQEDMALNAATSQSAVDAAIGARTTAEASAASAAGISLSTLARAQIAAARGTAAGIAAASMPVAVAINIQAELNDVETAHSDLYNAISASMGTSAKLSAAWTAYHNSVNADINSTLDAVHSGSTAAVASVESSTAGALSTLNSSVASAGTNGTAIANAYATYLASVTSAVAGNSTLALFSAANQKLIVTLIVDSQTAK